MDATTVILAVLGVLGCVSGIWHYAVAWGDTRRPDAFDRAAIGSTLMVLGFVTLVAAFSFALP